MAILYIVGTPIGNLGDMTLRAIETLKRVDVIFAEDTRETRKLLSHFGITTPISSMHIRDEKRAAGAVISELERGKSVALVTDAGTPGISDPGSKLVSLLVDKFKVYDPKPEASGETELINIQTIPGPSALTAALSVAGVPASEFVFLGFLPHKKGRETLFKEIAASERTMVFYESPHRILKTLESLQKFAPTKKVTIARELTKIHEQIIFGSAAELLVYFENNPDKVRGEFVVVVA